MRHAVRRKAVQAGQKGAAHVAGEARQHLRSCPALVFHVQWSTQHIGGPPTWWSCRAGSQEPSRQPGHPASHTACQQTVFGTWSSGM
eukprot:361491-Chlamydomonas_euryale.AAC.1